MAERRIIEINGVKVDVDLREAVAVETMRVGDPVRVLKKEYGGTYKVYSGVVIGFDQFKALPTITIAYIDISYSDADVKFLAFNSETKDAEVIRADEASLVAFDAKDAVLALDKKIEKAERDLKDARAKRDYFITEIGKAWTPAQAE